MMYKILIPFSALITTFFYPVVSFAQNRIENTGNVGIGTTSPTVKLSVYGPSDDSAAISLQSGTNSRFYIQQGGTMLKIGGITQGVGAINILNTGRVGIGTNAPTSLLDVNGDFRLGITTGGTAYSIGFTRSAGAQLYGTTASGLTLGGDATGIDAVVLPNGNVGIGTSSPAAKLDVAGAVQTSNEFTTYTGIGTGGLVIANAARVPRWVIRGVTPETGANNGGYDLDIQRRNDAGAGIGTALYIRRSDGNVGIGTIPGDFKLSVEGTIGARKVKVTQGSWADFVFKPDYKLPSLTEVEAYVRTHGHLRDIPSEQEVVSDGLDLGEMNKKLLQKIEELTLYLIDMKRDINQLKQQNELLNEKINKDRQNFMQNE